MPSPDTDLARAFNLFLRHLSRWIRWQVSKTMSTKQFRQTLSGSRGPETKLDLEETRVTLDKASESAIEVNIPVQIQGEILEITHTPAGGALTDGSEPITTADVTAQSVAGGFVVNINGTRRYVPFYAVTV